MLTLWRNIKALDTWLSGLSLLGWRDLFSGRIWVSIGFQSKCPTTLLCPPSTQKALARIPPSFFTAVFTLNSNSGVRVLKWNRGVRWFWNCQGELMSIKFECSGSCFVKLNSEHLTGCFFGLVVNPHRRGSCLFHFRAGQVRHASPPVSSELCCPGTSPRRWIRRSLHASPRVKWRFDFPCIRSVELIESTAPEETLILKSRCDTKLLF